MFGDCISVCDMHQAKKDGATVAIHDDSRLARLRLMAKRILRKHKYPPDQQDGAVELVLQQARALGEMWAQRLRGRTIGPDLHGPAGWGSEGRG